MGESGVPVHAIARVLKHIDGTPRATNTYDRHTCAVENLRALETWEQRLDHILTRIKSAVVPFRTPSPQPPAARRAVQQGRGLRLILEVFRPH